MSFSFYLDKLETRSQQVNSKLNYIVRGYATTPNNIYSYKKYQDRSFKEYFTPEAINNIKRKAKSQKVFVDIEHNLSTKLVSEKIISEIQTKTGQNFHEELDYLKSRIKFSDIPMFKVEDVDLDERGLFVDIHGNPFYRDIDEEHKNYFDAVWGSLESGFINGMSLNFRPISVKKINEELNQIDDIDLLGISLTGGAANDMASITEVAIRSIEHFGGDYQCQKIKTSTLML